MRKSITPGLLLISLDFELYWGLIDVVPLHEYRSQLLGARRAIPQILRLFEHYAIHATWATVGMLFCACREELISTCPVARPAYRNEKLSSYRHITAIGRDESDDPFHYGGSLIREICSVPNQEIATHTFSHYYCLEPGQTRTAFTADLDAAIEIAARRGLTLKSIVFPRNQCNLTYLAICEDRGLTAYRGIEPHWFAAPDQARHRRFMRLVDSYVPLSGDNTYLLAPAPAAQRIINLPASRFFRVKSWLRVDRKSLLGRIKSSLTCAAQQQRVYHLWWHPHNFGSNPVESIGMLSEILEHVAVLRTQYDFTSRHMAEVAQMLRGNEACASA